MTPDKHSRVCVVIVTVLLVIHCSSGARSTPERRNGQVDKGTKTQEPASRTQESIPSKGKSSNGQKATRTFDCIEEDTECTKDKFGYEAIIALHHLIDDDRNGNVDQSESDEFLRDELQYTDGFERHSLFHNNDKLISVDDLWRAWKYSKVYNWTVDDVMDWLVTECDLPQYSNMFQQSAVSGPFLPRLASSHTFMSTVLGIKNPVHKQKLALKAMDTVLFGAPPKRHNYVKDLVLVILLIVAVGGCWFAYLHHRYSQEQVRKMMVDLESLQKAEEALMDVQRKLEDAESRQVSSVPRGPPDFKEGTSVPEADLPVHSAGANASAQRTHHHHHRSHHHRLEAGEGTQQIKEELAATQLALQLAESQLENTAAWSAPGELQAWLQLTHELEQVHYDNKRQAAERQFHAAKEGCDKIKRRNKAFFGSLRMAHSNSLDEIDQRILDARVALEEVKQDLQERTQRWHNVERLCSFSVITNPGLPTLHTLLYGAKESANGAHTLHQGVGDADEDLPPAGYPAMPHPASSKAFLRQRAMMGSSNSLAQLSRQGVNVSPHGPSSLTTPHGPGGRSGSMDSDAASSPTSGVASPVNFHLGDMQPMNNNHGRSKSITPSLASAASLHYYPGNGAGAIPGGGGRGSLSRASEVDIYTSDDNASNLSQATINSLTPSSSSARLRPGVNNNGLDLVSHTHQGQGQSSPSSPEDRLLLGPSLLSKKPSKRKKLMNIFRKSVRQKPV